MLRLAMPIPTPNEGEEKQEYIERCMSNETMVEEYDQDQRAAICNEQWRNRNDSNMDKKLRIDKGKVRDWRYDEEDGVMTAKVTLTKSQVLPYRDDSGEIVKELLPPDELSDDDWLESTKGKPITNDHPPNPLNLEDLSEHSKGTLHDKPEVEEISDNQVKVDNKVTIFNDDLIQEIKNGKDQVSIGRRVDVIREGGEYKGDSYDRVQRNFRLNHLAIVDQGRAGPDVKMRLDGGMVEVSSESNNTKIRGADIMSDKDEKELKYDLGPVTMEFGEDQLDEEAQESFQKVVDHIKDLKDEKNKLKDEKETLEKETGDLEDKLKDKEDDGEDNKVPKDEVDELIEDEKKELLGSIDAKIDVIHETKNIDDGYEPQYDKSLIELKKDFIKKVDEGASLENKSDGYIEIKYENLRDSIEKRKSKPVGDNKMVPDEDMKEDLADKRSKLQDPSFLRGDN